MGEKTDLQYQAADDAFRKGVVQQTSSGDLLNMLEGLTNTNNRNVGTQTRDLMRAMTITFILQQRDTERLEERSAEVEKVNIRIQEQNIGLQKWVVRLATAALIAAVVQVIVALWPSVVTTYSSPAAQHPPAGG